MLPWAKNGVAAVGPSHVAGVRIGQVHGASRWRVGKRCSGSDIVNVVALQPFVEGSEAATENRLAVSEDVFRETNAGLQRFVVVLDQSGGGSTLTRPDERRSDRTGVPLTVLESRAVLDPSIRLPAMLEPGLLR